MERKGKYIIMLLVVLSLIYLLKPSVLYAGEVKLQEETAVDISENSDEAVSSVGIDEEEDNTGEFEKDDEREEGKSKEEAEDSTKEEESKETGEVQEPEDSDSLKEKEKPILKYDLKVSDADGENGYYRKYPEIVLRHISERGETHYLLKHGDKKLAEGVLKEKNSKNELSSKSFTEGKNILHIWMTDENGEDLDEKERHEEKRSFLIDSREPKLELQAPQGFEHWYMDEIKVTVKGEDEQSGIKSLVYKVDGEVVGKSYEKAGEFVVKKESHNGQSVEIAVVAQDQAGNTNECIKKVYMDRKTPKLTYSGMKNYMISGKAIQLVCTLEDENILSEFSAEASWEKVNGREKEIRLTEWIQEDNKRILRQKFVKDGIYRIDIMGKDRAGHTVKQKLQIIIDKTSPIIRYIDSLQGKHLKRLEWSYPVQRLIEDFTTYTYEMRLDGKIYTIGKSIEKEGRHRLAVQAVDAAGNQSYAKADFVIDHTPPEITIKGAEEGKEYEEECNIEIKVRDPEDRVQQIAINGKIQQIDSTRKSYLYKLNQHQNYVVDVKASDLAGNFSERAVRFAVLPKATTTEKIVKPLLERINQKKYTSDNQEGEGENKKQENHRKAIPAIVKAAGITSLGILIGMVYFLYYRKKSL